MIHKIPQTICVIDRLRREEKLMLRAKVDYVLMWTVKQNVFLILNSVPVTLVTDPEFIRKVVARKAKASKCAAEVAGNIHAKVERQHRFMIPFSIVPPARSIPQRHTKMSVICSHNSAGMMSLIWRKIVKVSPIPDNMFTQSELKPFHINRLTRTYSIRKVLKISDILKRIRNLISPRIISICKEKVSPYNFLKKRIV